MPLTPLKNSTPGAEADEDSFTANHRRLFEMVKAGKSWSGYERNCCFLNTGSGRFANVSAISGFDHLDDARGLALVDWDHDGDLDLWVTNRTAPRVRVMRNDTSSGHHFLAVRLEGSTSNRDAIGARAELTIEGARGDRKLIKTVRAGDGYLAQSSKWLHFGLGESSRVTQLAIRWPGGREERFTDLRADTRYRIVEGTGNAIEWTPPPRKVQLVASKPTLPAETLQAVTLLSMPLPLPPLEYTGYDQQPATLSGPRDKPLLVNLWASWCMPCARELADFTARSEELRAAGLDILALSVDGLGGSFGGGQSTTPEDARRFLAKLNFPFSSGVATVGLLEMVQIVHNQLFAIHRPLPVPTSLLIDTEGQLAAIYKGPVATERLLADVERLSKGREAWGQTALPFEGRWHEFPQSKLVDFVATLFEQGHVDEAIQYTLQNKPRLAGDSKFSWLLHRVGRELSKRGELDAAIAQFRDALAVDADDFQAHNNLGVMLRSQKKFDEAVRHLRRAAQLRPGDNAVHTNLAMALQSSGQLDEAINHFRRATELRPNDPAAHAALGDALIGARKTDEALSPVRRALELQPEQAIRHHNMAILLRLQGKTDEAIARWREAVRLEPDRATAHYLLGQALQSQGKVDDAIEAFSEALRHDPDNARYRRNLSAAQAKKQQASAP